MDRAFCLLCREVYTFLSPHFLGPQRTAAQFSRASDRRCSSTISCMVTRSSGSTAVSLLRPRLYSTVVVSRGLICSASWRPGSRTWILLNTLRCVIRALFRGLRFLCSILSPLVFLSLLYLLPRETKPCPAPHRRPTRRCFVLLLAPKIPSMSSPLEHLECSL